VPWYRKDQHAEAIPVPILGPDIIDPRQLSILKEEIAKRRAEAAQEMATQAAQEMATQAAQETAGAQVEGEGRRGQTQKRHH